MSYGDEDIASAAYVAALEGKPIKRTTDVWRIAAKKTPQNQAAMAMAALIHAGMAPLSDFDRLTGPSEEFGSGLYHGSWSLSTFATTAHELYRSLIALHALCLVDVEYIELQDLEGVNARHRNYGMAGYHGPISMLPGNRMLWDRGKASLYAERSIAGPLAAWAMDQPWKWNGYSHEVMGWAMWAVTSTDQGNMVCPDPWPELGGTAKPKELVELASGVPMQPDQRLDLFYMANGDRLAVFSRNSANTRGAVLVTRYAESSKTLRWISPAEPTSSGEWTALAAEVDPVSGEWETWQRSRASKTIRGEFEGVEVHIVLDSKGARIEGGEPERLPAPVPETQSGLLSFDAAGRKVAMQGESVHGPERDDVLRTVAEVMRRTTEGHRDSARQGAQDLLNKMKGLGW